MDYPSPSARAGSIRMVAEILLVILLALALRLYDLLILPIFLDEATYLNWAAEIWDQRTLMALFIPMTDDGKQPLFMWLAGGVSYVFPDPLMAGRVVSALAGALSAAGVYLAGRWLAGGTAGLIGGLLYAVVPFNVFYDRLALVEALLNSAGVWTLALSIYLSSRAKSLPRAVVTGIGLGMALGIGIWTKMPAVFMLGFPVLAGLLLTRREKRRMAAWGFATGAGSFLFFAGLLLLSPNADSIFDKSSSFSEPAWTLVTFPIERWIGNLQRYWDWFVAYLPAPLWVVVLASAVWGLVRRTRVAMFLLGSWACFTMPTVLMAITRIYESRYVWQGVFPLLLILGIMLAAIYQSWMAWVGRHSRGADRSLPASAVAGAIFLAIVGPSLMLDQQLLVDPPAAPLPATDYSLFITGWSSGYGFPEAVSLVRERAAELTKDGQPVIVLGYYWRGHTHAGLKLYLRRMPNTFFYVDMHLARDPEGFLAAWRSHGVPVLVVGNQGIENLGAFERGVPQARRIGFFPKPGGISSFRVYEVAREAFAP